MSTNGGGVGYSDATPIMVQAELGAAGNTVRTHSEEVWTQLTQLRANIDMILAHWQGGASAMFVNLKAEWDAAAGSLFRVGGILPTIADALDINWRNYQETEDLNRRTWLSH